MGRWRSRRTAYKHVKKRKRLRMDRAKSRAGTRTTRRRGTKTKVVPGSTKGSGGRKQSKGTKYKYAMGTRYHPRKKKS